MAKVSTSDFQKGMFIEFKGEPHQIVEFLFVNPGKGSAFVRTKLKNILTSKVQEFTFKSGEKVEETPINVREMQYLYKNNDQYVFMDKLTYEQVEFGKDTIGNFHQYLKGSEEYQLLFQEDRGIGMKYPKKVKLLVTSADEAIKGNTVTGAKKVVQLETGINLTVPLFIKKGDLVTVDPETGEYVERVSQG